MVAVVASIWFVAEHGKTRSQGTEKMFSGSLYLAVVDAMI
jgi:hypothetical protein